MTGRTLYRWLSVHGSPSHHGRLQKYVTHKPPRGVESNSHPSGVDIVGGEPEESPRSRIQRFDRVWSTGRFPDRF